jgi:hypothetical protein
MATAVADMPNQTLSRTDVRKRVARVFDARRRLLSLDVEARVIAVAPAASQSDVALMELNATGFRVATTEPIPQNTVFSSDLMSETGAPVRQPARVLYCRRQRPDGHDGGYVSQLEFDGPEAA